MEQPHRGFWFALNQHTRVVASLMLRDIKTRLGASYFGFLLGLLLPLLHITVVLTVYTFLGRRAPIGTNVMLYLTTAILPFILWSYTHQQVSRSFSQNKVLLSFPIVRLIDILIARSLVEMLNATLIVIIVTVVFVGIGIDLWIDRPDALFLALVLAYCLGTATGFIFGLVSLVFPGALIFGFILIPLYWVTCGIFFIPDTLPPQIREYVVYFPLSHIVDFARVSLYSSYISDYYNLSYVFALTMGIWASCLFVQRVFRANLA